MKIIDISVPLNEHVPIFEGNPPFSVRWAMRISDGDQVNLTELREGVHTGTHIDAPKHFIDKGRTIDRIPLSRFISDVHVLHCRGKSISERDLERVALRQNDGVLFRTSNSMKYGLPFFHDFVYLEEGAARELVRMKPSVVGIDYLSIEKFGSETAPAHNILLSHNIPIIEGLCLKGVREGRYTLISLPLYLQGREAAPARAVLIDPPLGKD